LVIGSKEPGKKPVRIGGIGMISVRCLT